MRKDRRSMDDLPDIRSIIRAWIVRQRWSTTEAARKISIGPAALHQTIEGARAVSGRAFNAMLREWGVAEDPDAVRSWLAAFVVDRLGTAGGEWLAVAGWTGEPVEEPKEDPFAPYEPLGPTSEKARRRLSILRRLYEAGEKGCTFASMQSAACDTAGIVEIDMKFLEDEGYVEHWTGRATLKHSQLGTYQRAKRRATLRYWKLTQAGKRITQAMEGLSDARGANEACGASGEV